jgi:hypothetical protein
MLLVTQLPLSDARRFAPDRAWRLAVPDWPTPKTFNNPQFVRHFGGATDRAGGDDAAWKDEIAFCRAHRAVGMPDLEKYFLGNGDVGFQPDCAFRRLLVDKSTVVGRLEVAVRGPRKWALPSTATPSDVLSIADAYLNLPVRVPDRPDVASLGPLATQGRRIARLYEYATTVRQHRTEQRRLVEDGLPLLIIQADDGEPFVPPQDAKVIPR